MWKNIASAVILLVTISSAEHHQVALSGVVSNRTGIPLNDVIVRLEMYKLYDNTDNSGYYAIDGLTVTNALSKVPLQSFIIRNGLLLISLDKCMPVQINLFSIKGELVTTIADNILASGSHIFELPQNISSFNVYIIRSRIGSQTTTTKYIHQQRTQSHTIVPSASNALARKKVSTVDTIRASKAGYITKRIGLSSFTGTVDIQLDSLQKNDIGTSPIDDGSEDRIALYGVDQFFWGTVGTGNDEPIVKITHALSTDVVDIKAIFNPHFVDLTYGTNVVGWNRHTFEQLHKSDHVELAVTNGDGDTVFHGRIDLLSPTTKTTSGYASLGATGGDGVIYKGSASDILSFGTSLDDNINYYGYELFSDSPETDSMYTPNPQYPYWQYYAVYRLSLRADIFGPSGYGEVRMTSVHASPGKDGAETIQVIEKPGPEPGSPQDPFRFYIPTGMIPPDTIPSDTIDIPIDTIPDDTFMVD